MHNKTSQKYSVQPAAAQILITFNSCKSLIPAVDSNFVPFLVSLQGLNLCLIIKRGCIIYQAKKNYIWKSEFAGHLESRSIYFLCPEEASYFFKT